MVKVDEKLDCKGLSCPMPIIKLAKKVRTMTSGQILLMEGTDPGSKEDIPGWCSKTGHNLLGTQEKDGVFYYYIKLK